MKKKLLIITGILLVSISCKKESTTPQTNDSNVTSDSTSQLEGVYGPTIKDVDGNNYKTVKIGSQVWMAENLKTTRYNDSTIIPNVTDYSEWQYTTRAWRYYKDKSEYNELYGKLYNWNTIDKKINEDKNICPNGWHLPSIEEWKVLVNHLGGDSIAGGKLKQAGIVNWIKPNKDATNSSLFNALPGGFAGAGAGFSGVNALGSWWTYNPELSDTYTYKSIYLIGNSGQVFYRDAYSAEGLSVRCLKDE
jgi:uncharacterized protein (TIGR02145 family)